MSGQSLMVDIKKHLPMRVYGNGPVIELLREMGRPVDKKTPLNATAVFKDSESGEIVCELTFEDNEKVTAALTNLRVDISHKLFRKIKNYRNEVANDLATQGQEPGVNSQSFRVGNLYGKK